MYGCDPASYHLIGSANNITNTVTSVTVVDSQLTLQKKLVEARRELALATPPVLLGALLAWMSGFFSWVVGRLTSTEPPKKRLSVSAARVRRNKKRVGWRMISCVFVILLGLIVMITGLLFTAFCPPTLAFFLSSIATTLVGVALIALGAWFVRPGHNIFSLLNAV